VVKEENDPILKQLEKLKEEVIIRQLIAASQKHWQALIDALK